MEHSVPASRVSVNKTELVLTLSKENFSKSVVRCHSIGGAGVLKLYISGTTEAAVSS